MSEDLEIAAISESRFDLRTFCQNFDAATKRMALLSVPVSEKVWERSCSEIYILSRTNDIKKSPEELGLVGVENTNYLQAIKRVIG